MGVNANNGALTAANSNGFSVEFNGHGGSIYGLDGSGVSYQSIAEVSGNNGSYDAAHLSLLNKQLFKKESLPDLLSQQFAASVEVGELTTVPGYEINCPANDPSQPCAIKAKTN